MSIYHQKYNQNLFTNPNTSFYKIFSFLKPLKPKKILDIGCSSGFLGKYVKSKFSKTVFIGIDNNLEDIKIASKFLDKAILFNLETENLSDIFKKDKFNVIILADILEHLSHPEKLLKNIHQIIGPKSTLIISIPNITHQSTIINLLNKNWEYKDTGILDKTHLRFFSRKSICQLLKENGYLVKKIDYTTKEEKLPLWKKPLRIYLNDPDFKAYQYIIKAEKN